MLGLNYLFLFIFSLCLAREPPTVTVPNQGILVGKEMAMVRTHRIYAYLGIPYAQPPLGNLRFAPPKTEPLPSWSVPRNATEYAPACLQTNDDYKPHDLPFLNLISNLNFEVDEDCLYLNVFIPYGKSPPDGFATIVWIHPGNFTTGSPNIWNPHTMVERHGVIVITVAWRLNIMGFFSSMDGEAPGNFGLMDQQAALLWINRNVNIFGGNSEKICLMGYGAGAVSVGLHMINQQSRGLFAKAIVMSGNFFHPSAVRQSKEDEAILDDLAEFHGCDRRPTPVFLECLRDVKGIEMVKYASEKGWNWRPSIDRDMSNATPAFLPELPRSHFESGDFYPVPLLTGYTDMEDVLRIQNLIPQNLPDNDTDEFLFSTLSEVLNWDLLANNETVFCSSNNGLIMDSVWFFYGPTVPVKEADAARKLITDFATEMAVGSSMYLQASFASKYQPTYVYRFDTKPRTAAVVDALPEWVSVPHLFDLIYVWGVPYWAELPDGQTWDPRDKMTSDVIMSLWTNFAKFSNPTEIRTYSIRWDKFTPESPGILIVDRTFNMSDASRLNYKSFEFWNEFYPKLLSVTAQCCNVSDTSHAFHNFSYNFGLFCLMNLALVITFPILMRI